ncbi:MAG: NAD(P)H-dependent glycerol-3-phosphate dehydrogenase [Bacteroidia bacterium]
MNSKASSSDTVGVIGAGSFGTALANLLAANRDVYLYARRPEVAAALQRDRAYKGRPLHDRVQIITDLDLLTRRCELIFPVVPSTSFRPLLLELAPMLLPSHKIIHGTKGLYVDLPPGETLQTVKHLRREQVHTMSELIRAETVVLRVGCVAGPNLAHEIVEGQPAACVVASPFEEVIREGQSALRSSRFRVHGNHDLVGIELAGVLKNIMAIASGILHGQGYGDNTKALLVTHGLAEMIYIGTDLGADVRAFLGLGGIGDLVATCSSPHSRNFTVGYRLGRGELLQDILADMDEVAEGINTVAIVYALIAGHRISAPITLTLHRILFEQMDISKGMRLLMEYPFTEDAGFL